MRYVEVKYMPERSRLYLGSPTLLRLPDGAIVAAHDYFNEDPSGVDRRTPRLTSVYRSEDDGATWQNAAQIVGASWCNLFWHRGALYLFGCTRRYGDIVIRRSADGGFTWTRPLDGRSGLLFPAGAGFDAPNYHCAPTPVLSHGGRLWRAFEDNVTGHFPTGFQACVLSADENADLLRADAWTLSARLPIDRTRLPAEWGGQNGPGFLEGNMVADPEGRLWDVMRISSEPCSDFAALVSVSPDGRRLAFDYERDVIRLPGGTHKFTIRRDPANGLYLTLGNNNTVPGQASQRNVLSLAYSADLRNWKMAAEVLRDESGLSPEDSLRLTGFQYVDWQFDGDNLIYLVRTAYRGAPRFHDSNRITYHVLNDFRSLLADERPSEPGTGKERP